MESTHVRQLIISASFCVAIAAHMFVVRWLLASFAPLRDRRRLVIGVAVAVFLTAPLGRVVGALHWKGLASTLSALGAIEWMVVMLGALPLALVILIAWLARRVDVEGETSASARVTRREAAEKVAGLAVFGASGLALGWGAVRGRHEFVVEEVVVRLPGLPRALDGYTIAQISDVHAGLFVGDRELDEGFSKVRAVRPDLVVVTGDLVDFDARFAPALARRLGDLRGRDGVVAVLGNHDYYAGYRVVTPLLRAAGVDVLINEGRVVRPGDGGGFALLGIDDLWAARSGGVGPDLGAAVAMVSPDLPRVLLAHQPNFFPVARGKVGLQLSGHTHGGQINPGFKPAELLLHYLSGRYEEGGSTLWVNRGFGVAGPPSRIGAPPEVTKVVLVSA